MRLRNAALAGMLMAAFLAVGLTAHSPASAADRSKPAFNISPLVERMAKAVTEVTPQPDTRRG